MKNIFIILLVLLLTACSSTPRFTKDREHNRGNSSISYRITTGIASYYADEFHGRKTANGEIYDMNKLTAAHPDLPFNTVVKVTNLKNNRSVNVRINDRMPDFKKRIIDVSLGAAKQLDMVSDGIVEVKIEILATGE